MTRLAGAIFDLDGTLADTLPACYAAFRVAGERLDGPPYTNTQIRALFGPSEEGMRQRAMPDRWEKGLEVAETFDAVEVGSTTGVVKAAAIAKAAAAWAPSAIAAELAAPRPHALFEDAAELEAWLVAWTRGGLVGDSRA